ncbi:hypothetical protein PSHT_05556 [Puccinia striiformis]|uniref:Uncharacterized protein n=1 Tax=Puccinia striiformis TaxID=27350 RepID=A0A2S4WAE4_9BASI|nr:hypothetical protein PSHT_05556 [Puccinia striiformis]
MYWNKSLPIPMYQPDHIDETIVGLQPVTANTIALAARNVDKRNQHLSTAMKVIASIWIAVMKLVIRSKAAIDLELRHEYPDFYLENWNPEENRQLLEGTPPVTVLPHPTSLHPAPSCASATNGPTLDPINWSALDAFMMEDHPRWPLSGDHQDTDSTPTELMLGAHVSLYDNPALNTQVNWVPDSSIDQIPQARANWVSIAPADRVANPPYHDLANNVFHAHDVSPTHDVSLAQDGSLAHDGSLTHDGSLAHDESLAHSGSLERLTTWRSLDALGTTNSGPRKRRKISADTVEQIPKAASNESARREESIHHLDELIAASRDNTIPTIAHYQEPPITQDEITMHEYEGGDLRLIFDENVFQEIPEQDPRFLGVPDIMKSLIKREAKNDLNDQLLLIRSAKTKVFIEAFNKQWKPSSNVGRDSLESSNARPSVLAADRMSVLHSNLKMWMGVYQKRLGIDFLVLLRRMRQIFAENSHPSKLSGDPAYKIIELSIYYLFFVDMIITILPQPTRKVLNRIETFKTALTCFEMFTKESLQNNTFKTRNIKRVAHVWQYVSHWLETDQDYSRARISDHSGVLRDWKSFFTLVFAHSIDRLTKRHDLEYRKTV